MRVLLWIVGGLAVLIAVAWGIGYMQPLDHTATYSAVMPAGLDEVWDRIANVEAQPAWRKGLSVRPAEPKDGLPCWQETQGKTPLQMCIAVSRPKTMREVLLSSPGVFNGTWTYVLQPVSENQTRVQMSETVVVYRPWWRFLLMVLVPNILSKTLLKQMNASFHPQATTAH